MNNLELLKCLSDILDSSGLRNGALPHDKSGTHLLRYESTSDKIATVYSPLLCLVLQGAKEVGTSAKKLTIRDGQSLIVTHSLPVVSRVTEATRAHPYIALVVPLDLDLLRSLTPSIRLQPGTFASDPYSISLCDTDDEMLDALRRYFYQCETDEVRRLLAPITLREIHARLLMGLHSETLRKLLWHESTTSRIFQATQDIQSNLAKTIVVGELAQHVGMSSSTFFEHFRAVTGTSPLQYQKELRLLHARDHLQSTSEKVSKIAFSVGYKNSAQFSREYSRKFGLPPRRDRGMDQTE